MATSEGGMSSSLMASRPLIEKRGWVAYLLSCLDARMESYVPGPGHTLSICGRVPVPNLVFTTFFSVGCGTESMGD
eukprot:6644942-Pyramimonas_sp.AAC.1